MPKYNVRRKAQLGLDIREGGIAIPIANNMFYIDGRKHAAGGVAIGPNNKNGVEVEGGEVVEMIDSNHPSVGRQFKAGGQKQTMRVFSSVPFLRGASPAELVLGGANPDAVFKAQEEFKDRNRINDDGTRYEVGGEKIYQMPYAQKIQYARTGKLNIGGYPITPLNKGIGALKALSRFKNTLKKTLSTGEAFTSTIKGAINDVTKNSKTHPSKTARAAKSIYDQFIGRHQERVGLLQEYTEDRALKKYGGEDDTKTAALKRLRNKFTITGDYGGGMFGGAGAGSVIMAQPEFITDTITKRYLVPVTQNFNDAFDNAVNASLDKFMFDKKWYTTEKGNNPNNNAAGAARTQTVYLPVEHKEVRRREKQYGGSSNYYSIMEKVAKDNYKQWGFNNEDEALIHALNDNTYDYRGYYNKYPNSLANADTHWTDEFKIVYHPTFSIESKYSGNKSIYNPLGLKGGYWNGDDFVPAKWQKNKKQYGGSMIYTINGNVRNGLMSARPKAQYGLATKYLKKKNKTTEKPVGNKQKDEPKVLDIRNTAGYKIKQAVENPWVKYPVEVASYLLSGATAKGMNLIGTVGKKAAKEIVNKTDDVVFKFGKTRKNKEDIILNTVDEIGISNRFTKPVETTISYKPQTRFRDGKTYVVKEKTIKKVAEKRFTPKKEVIDKNITTYTPPKNNTGNTINFEDAIIVRKQMDPKTSRELDKVYRKAVGNKEPKSGFGRVPQQTTIEYTPKGESINAYDASVEFHKRVSDMLYDSYVKKYGKKGVDKAMKREHISKYEYGGRIKAEGGKFLKYKNGVFTDPESGEEYDVDPEVFKMYGNSFEEGVIPLDDRQYRGKLRIITNPRNQKTGDSYIINPLTGEWIRNGVTKTSEPSVKGTTKVASKSSSTARGRGITSASSVSSRSTAKVESPKPTTATNPMEARYASRVQKGQAQEVIAKPVVEYNESSDKNPDKYRYTRAAGFKNEVNTSSTGGGTQDKSNERLIPQFKPINTGDWIGLGSNLAGHIASYFINNNLLKKYPMPTKPVPFQAAKLKTTHNINPDLANINEVSQMNIAEVGRNTASSSTSIARKQRIMNEARDARNKLYGQKENIETQLINLDRRNRQDIHNRNIAAYNDWLDKTYVAKTNKMLDKQRNIMSLVNGIPSAVNYMLGNIENRKSTNNTLQAIALANPSVDGRLFGIGDYYVGEKTKKKYDKFSNLIG